jgi:hypothetical protein
MICMLPACSELLVLTGAFGIGLRANGFVLDFSSSEDEARLVSVCSGQIGYALVPMIARGIMLGADQPVILHMLDIPPAAESLNGVKMELTDAAFPLLKGMTETSH